MYMYTVVSLFTTPTLIIAPPLYIQACTKKLERLACHDIKHGSSRRQCER